MKKVFCQLLTIMLLFSLVADAEGINISPDMAQVTIPKTRLFENEPLTEPLSPAGDYTVTVDGNMNTVNTGALEMTLNVPQGYECFTRDYWASLPTYSRFGIGKDLTEALAAENVHFLIINLIYNEEIHVVGPGSDPLSEEIGNMRELPEKYYDTVGTVLADSMTREYKGIYETDSNIWLRLGFDYMVTVVNGEYIILRHGAEEATEEVGETLIEIAKVLTVK